jgi:hypothetical protein
MNQGMIACVDCGQQLHASADLCPGCKSRTPQGLTCILCKNVDRASNIISMRLSRWGEPDSNYEVRAHASCMHERGLPSACLDCRHPLGDDDLRQVLGVLEHGYLGRGLSTSSDTGRCPYCRSREPLQLRGMCKICGTPVSEAAMRRFGDRTYHAECFTRYPPTTGCLTLLLPWLA